MLMALWSSWIVFWVLKCRFLELEESGSFKLGVLWMRKSNCSADTKVGCCDIQ